VYLFLPVNSFKFSCYCFAGINNRLFRRNNRLFFLVLCCFVLNIFANWISDWVSYKVFCSSWKSFQKPLLNSSPTLSFKTIYFNNWHQELGTWKILKFDPKPFFSMAGKLPFEEGASINKPPLFCGLNYTYWEARMKIFHSKD